VLCTGELEFAGQASQTAVPGAALCVPAAHCEQVPPLGPVVPATHVQSDSAVLAAGLLPELTGHVRQSASALLPGVSRYFPDAQSSQPVAEYPVFALYLPMAHALQSPPSGPLYPALHLQSVVAVLSRGELEFSGQALQTAFPVAALYVPVAHCEHVFPLGPVEPELQIQSISSSLATAGVLEFAGQFSHVSDVAPTAVEYLPYSQLLHAESAGAILYFPAIQLVQVPPSGS